ncbi:MAG: hypothetical protein ABIF85_07830 [Nanoarchaeota archaeon]|nr:hypothetical protein [Nanoarchaeota archaeon]MBU4300451.1 hypothetical protein [Nanoarchaeota archaeon]MBU4451666.1 hypothetical protein [Nanoarchaeota archaeon]MCG2723400.1 hypothetical protein [archaeon]
MKISTILISLIFGLIFTAAFVSATPTADKVTITNPTSGSTTDSSVELNATSTANAICEYMVDGGGWTVMDITGGTNHGQLLSGLSAGSHNVHVHCCKFDNPGQGCGQAMNDHVIWDVQEPPAIPEYPSAAVPVILSMLSFGIIKMKM